MNKSIICILFAAALCGCGGAEKEAKAQLEQARAFMERNEFFAARSEIDSLRANYPKELGVLKEALALMREVDIKKRHATLLIATASCLSDCMNQIH